MPISARHPPWLVKKFYDTEDFKCIKNILERCKVNTVCQEARCPNMSECFSEGRITFLILGNRCSRSCSFCFVKKGASFIPEDDEISGIVKVVKETSLRHIVITSVTRDDLSDKGAGHFVKTVKAVKTIDKDITVEILIPDFMGENELIRIVCESGIDILNHNIETVPRLYHEVRPQADYRRSLGVLKAAGEFVSLTKSGIMLGLGETDEEVKEVFCDLRNAGVKILTVGQYLKPGKDNLEIKNFVPIEKFEFYEKLAYNIGFRYVRSGPFVRSSYGADRIMAQFTELK